MSKMSQNKEEKAGGTSANANKTTIETVGPAHPPTDPESTRWMLFFGTTPIKEDEKPTDSKIIVRSSVIIPDLFEPVNSKDVGGTGGKGRGRGRPT